MATTPASTARATRPRAPRAEATPTAEVPEYTSRVPYFGHLLRAWHDPIALFGEAKAAHPGAVRLVFGPHHYVLVSSPASIKHVLVDNAQGYVKSRNYDGLKVVFGQGLLTSEGDFWKRQRRLVQPAFHRQKLAKLARTMTESTRRMLDRARTHGAPEHVHEAMMRLTFAIVGRALFSVDLEGEASAIGEALTTGLEWTNDYAEALVRVPPWLPTPKNLAFKRALRTLDDLVLRIVEERRRQPEPGDDLLGMLLSATDETGKERMSDRQIRDESLTLVVAGHETTASLLAFALYGLAEHPAWQARVVDEVREVLGDRDPTFDDVPKLALTRAVVDETMRLYPPAWAFERQALEDDTIAEGRIRKGAIVGVSTFLLHRDPELFPEPEVFDPNRFLPGAPERHKLAYIPFGGGPRTCIGNSFAITEAVLVLAMLVRELRAERIPGKPLVLDPKVTLRPKGDVPVRLVRRA